MILVYLAGIIGGYFFIKGILLLIVWRFGKISYEGFSAAGFKYDPYQNLFYSTKYAWQKSLGYTRFYDIMAPFGRMNLDTLPITFSYQDKNYLIVFWKGQYGIVTGAEIGIYGTFEQNITRKTIYQPITDEEMLLMQFTLYKNGKELLRIKNKHWWLAAFKLGLFSKPKELTMDLSITFPNKEMLSSFLDGFCKHGYTYRDYKVIDTTFYFVYQKPKAKKVWTKGWLIDTVNNYFNKKNVELYNKYLKDLVDVKGFPADKKLRVQNIIPDFLKNKEEYDE